MAENWEDFVSQEPEIVETLEVGFNVLRTTFENKKQQLALKSTAPTQSWRLKWGIIDENDTNNIYHFFVARSGTFEAFNWLHPQEKTTLDGSEVGNTVLNVGQTMRVLPGDTIRIADFADYTVADDGVNDAAKTITITGAAGAEAVAGAKVQIKYLVRFKVSLTLETIKTWLFRIGLVFERDLS